MPIEFDLTPEQVERIKEAVPNIPAGASLHVTVADGGIEMQTVGADRKWRVSSAGDFIPNQPAPKEANHVSE